MPIDIFFFILTTMYLLLAGYFVHVAYYEILEHFIAEKVVKVYISMMNMCILSVKRSILQFWDQTNDMPDTVLFYRSLICINNYGCLLYVL